MPAVSPPGYPLAACVHSPQCTTAACAQRPTLHYFSRMLLRHLVNIDQTQKLNCAAGAEFSGQGPRNWLPRQRPLTERQYQLIYSRGPTNCQS